MIVDTIEMSYLEALLQADLEDQGNVLLARNYHNGEQTVYLTARVEEFLELHTKVKFRLNVCQTITTAVQDELNVIGFDTTETADKDGKKAQADWASKLWQANRMDAMQNDVHEAALRDREAFIIVDWDGEGQRPRLTLHERYISTEAGGNGTGCWMIYENDDINQSPQAAVQQWTETIEQNGSYISRMRRTVYYPDRKERFVYNNGTWDHFEEEGVPWPIPWTRGKGKNAKPLGIPVFHFKNEGFAPEAWEAIPMQDAINKTLIDILGSADMAGFPIMAAIGFTPTTDGKAADSTNSNVMKIKPMQWIGTTKGKNEADIKKIEGSDVGPLMNILTELIALTSQITGTPVSRFIMTKQLAGADTIKEQDKPLQRKAAKRRVLFGDTWEDMMGMARKLENLYKRAFLDETVQFSTLWMYSASLDELQQKRTTLQIPLEQLWLEAGYSPEQITSMKNTQEYKLYLEKLLWEAAKAATDAGVTLETVLRRAGFTNNEFGMMATERLAAIKVTQEDGTTNPDGSALAQ
jgi:hypothetical protein